MTLELRVMSGSRAGVREVFEKSVVSVGRHPLSDLRFDPHRDLDVSARHAELRGIDDVWTIHDQRSTNGTFVNGRRVVGECVVRHGDLITFGANGPRVEVLIPAGSRTGVPNATPNSPSTVPARRDTSVRVAEALEAQTRTIRRALGGALGLLAAAVLAGVFLWRRQAAPRDADLMSTVLRRERSTLAMDVAAVHDRNDAAVALVASDLDGAFVGGTAFGVARSGLLVTNRHIARAASGRPARRIGVLFANTTSWLPAHVVRVDDASDLALLQLDAAGPCPVVAGVSRSEGRTRVGALVAVIGFPHGVDTPMEGSGLNVAARTTITVGTVSKRLADVIQVDSYAGKGSSGSPLFDTDGNVAGVIYGGAPESNGRIVYAVPVERLIAFLGSDAGAIPRH